MRRRPARDGASLFELVLVILLVGTGMVPVLAAFRDAAARAPLSELQTRAALLAAERMEEVLRDRAEPSRGWDWIAAANYPAESPVAGFAGFTRAVAVSDTTRDGVPLRRVTVSVSHALVPTVRLQTWFAEGAS